MQIFGSDGFRCKFGEKFMTPKFIYEFANSLGDFCLNNELSDPVLIARDTRASGIILEDLISGILMYKGIKVVLCGVLPTPGLSTILESGQYSLGIMITASHNPHIDNGIKLFDANGYKLKQNDDKKIEKGILCPKEMNFTGDYFVSKTSINAGEIYSSLVLNKFGQVNVNDLILIDCGNGACSEVVPSALRNYENIHFVNTRPSGYNINLDCGALEPEKLLKLVRNGAYQFGVAFDGDGDRAVFVSADYGIIESEKLIYLFYQILKSSNHLNVVVATEICNLALAHNLETIGVDLVETQVGDRFVTEQVRSSNAVLGGEPSGHYYFPASCKSMDGFCGLMHFLRVLDRYGCELIDTLRSLKHYDRITKNICVKGKGLMDVGEFKKKLYSEINSSEEKLVIRQSMWDPVLRIYYDYTNVNRFFELEQSINKLLSK
jgi:phosphoglucosamine mutase